MGRKMVLYKNKGGGKIPLFYKNLLPGIAQLSTLVRNSLFFLAGFFLRQNTNNTDDTDFMFFYV